MYKTPFHSSLFPIEKKKALLPLCFLTYLLQLRCQQYVSSHHQATKNGTVFCIAHTWYRVRRIVSYLVTQSAHTFEVQKGRSSFQQLPSSVVVGTQLWIRSRCRYFIQSFQTQWLKIYLKIISHLAVNGIYSLYVLHHKSQYITTCHVTPFKKRDKM